MEFRILGPLEVWHEGRSIPVRGARQRALLAVLLVRANQVISSDLLLDELWGDEPPEAGTTALRVRVSQLRKALDISGATNPIVTRAPGYLIEVEPHQLDLRRFERLLEEGRRSLDARDPVTAADRLREALELWRGPALADFAYEPFAQTAINRLEELRLMAVELKLEADLSLGRQAELVPELEALVAAHPLREGLRRQLMLALYQSGRQAEALQAYQAARSTLVEELGIEPGPALQGLERAILRQDAGLTLQAEEPSPERAILVAASDPSRMDDLLALAEPLARRPPRELIVVRLIDPESDLRGETDLVHEKREALRSRGLAARATAFTSDAPGDDLVRLADEQEVDLLLLDAPDALLADDGLRTVLDRALCDVGVFIARETPPAPGPVLVPFVGAEHDWAAIELAAWIARSTSAPIRLAGSAGDGVAGGRDASRLLGRASLAVQRALGVVAEPVLVAPGEEGLLHEAETASLVIVGLSDRWRREGLGRVRLALVTQARPPALVVRRGLRPGGLAPPESLTRFTWSIAAR